MSWLSLTFKNAKEKSNGNGAFYKFLQDSFVCSWHVYKVLNMPFVTNFNDMDYSWDIHVYYFMYFWYLIWCNLTNTVPPTYSETAFYILIQMYIKYKPQKSDIQELMWYIPILKHIMILFSFQKCQFYTYSNSNFKILVTIGQKLIFLKWINNCNMF